MKDRILREMQESIDRFEYGDITRNSLVSKLESIKNDIEEWLKENEED